MSRSTDSRGLRAEPAACFLARRRSVVGVLLAGICLWLLFAERFDRPTAHAWDRPVRVRVLPVIDHRVGDASAARGALDLGAIEAWFDAQHRRFGGPDAGSIGFELLPPVELTHAPPRVAPVRDGLLARWASGAAFLSFFEELGVRADGRGGSEAIVYVYFYPASARGEFSGRSAACGERSSGVVFVPLDPLTLPFYHALFTHEVCHALGASDKYDAHGSCFPEGYADPGRIPLHPQAQAEIMALGIPRSRRSEAYIDGIEACVIGAWTARELGW